MIILVHNEGKISPNLNVLGLILSLLRKSGNGEKHAIHRSDQIANIDKWSEMGPPNTADLILTTNFHYAMELLVRGKPVHWLEYKATEENVTYAIMKFLETRK